MITKYMKLELIDLGYTLKDINSFTPLEAHVIIADGVANSNIVEDEACDLSEEVVVKQTFSKTVEERSGLGNVRLKVTSAIFAIDKANLAIEKAMACN